ncbi:MAG: hypothetical protein QM681_01560 [Novosphingobium sp.]
MKAAIRLRSYVGNPDPLTHAANRIAVLVASSQPTYPLYVLWTAGGNWWVACWTFLSTPLFVAVPALARRNALGGRILLPGAGIANSLLAPKAMGEASGVELFLVPCALIGVLGIRRHEWFVSLALLASVFAALLLHGHYGAPLGRFDSQGYAALVRLNAASAGFLSLVVVWSFIRARTSSARP